jgi:hypothetical protein
MPESNDTQNADTTASTPLMEGYQTIKGYQLTIERGYQSRIISMPSLPPQGGSVIAESVQVTGIPSQGPSASLSPITPPQGGSVIATPAAVPEQK